MNPVVLIIFLSAALSAIGLIWGVIAIIRAIIIGITHVVVDAAKDA